MFVTEGRDAATIEALATHLDAHGCPPSRIESVSIDMSPAFIKGCTEHLPKARITFDKFHAGFPVDSAVFSPIGDSYLKRNRGSAERNTYQSAFSH